MDNTDQTQPELEKNETYLRSLFEHMLTGFAHCEMIFDAAGTPIDFRYLEVNPMFEKLTGLKDVTGKLVSEVIPGVRTSDPKLFEIYGRVATTGQSERFEIFLEALKIWFSISVYSVEKGFFTAVFDNITDRKDQELQLKKALQDIQNLMENIPEVLYVLDTQNNIIKWNRKAEEASGFSAEELSHKLVFELIPEHDRPMVINMVNDAYAKGYAEISSYLMKKDGTLVPYRWSAASLNDDNGNDTGVIGIGWDLTEQIQSEELFHAYQLRQRALMDIIPETVWMKDVNGVYLTVNEAFLVRVGKRREEVIGKTDFDFWPKEYAEKYLADDKEVIKSRARKRMEETVPELNGSITTVETIKIPVFDDIGKPLGVVGIARDIIAGK